MMPIKACFRRMKTTGLRIRPVDPWTAHRILSHIKLCGLALLLERPAEIRAGDTKPNIRLVPDALKAVRYRVVETTYCSKHACQPGRRCLAENARDPGPEAHPRP